MTAIAYAAWGRLRQEWDELIESLSPEEWASPSACAGWRVGDMVAHLAASAHSAVDPSSVGDEPMPENRERMHDVLVGRRSSWERTQVVEEYQTYVPQFADMVLAVQSEPAASSPIEIPGLGTYPMHLIANANVFDYYCHLHHDVLVPGGPVERSAQEPSHDTLFAALEWMMAGLPQMQGAALDDKVTVPITFRFIGPGKSEWTISRRSGGGLVTELGGGGDIVVESSAHAFVGWGTKRCDWRPFVTITGDQAAAEPLLDALNIV